MSEILTPAEVAEIEARCAEALMPYPPNGMRLIVCADVPDLIATLRQAWTEKDYWEMGSTQQYLMYQDSQRAVKQLLDDAVPFLDQNREYAYKDALRTIRQLREVLEFYADKANWIFDINDSLGSDIDMDQGERARKALGREAASEEAS